MTTRERNRYLLCQVSGEKLPGGRARMEAVQESFRESVLSHWGELGFSTFGTTSRMIISFIDTCGLFIIRVPMKAQTESLMALAAINSISSRPVSVRVLFTSGRLKNCVRATVDHVISWRNNLPNDYAVPRRDHLNQQVRKIVQELHSLPGYA